MNLAAALLQSEAPPPSINQVILRGHGVLPVRHVVNRDKNPNKDTTQLYEALFSDDPNDRFIKECIMQAVAFCLNEGSVSLRLSVTGSRGRTSSGCLRDYVTQSVIYVSTPRLDERLRFFYIPRLNGGSPYGPSSYELVGTSPLGVVREIR